MMKRSWNVITITLGLLLLVVGCQPNGGANMQEADQHGSPHIGIVQGKEYHSIYQDRNRPQKDKRSARPFAFDRDLGMNRDYDLGKTRTPGTRIGRDQIPYGYAHHSSNDADVIYQGYGANMYIDRQIVAEAISQIVVGLQDVTDATVVVSDDTCVIGYQGIGDEVELHDHVWRSGLSVTPRWFKVYATNDPSLLEQLNDLGTQPEGHTMNLNQMGQEINSIISQVEDRNQGNETLDQPMQLDSEQLKRFDQTEIQPRGILNRRGINRRGVQ
jgi:hypothetical protein